MLMHKRYMINNTSASGPKLSVDLSYSMYHCMCKGRCTPSNDYKNGHSVKYSNIEEFQMVRTDES